LLKNFTKYIEKTGIKKSLTALQFLAPFCGVYPRRWNVNTFGTKFFKKGTKKMPLFRGA